jgi:hypothetical protein
MPNISPGGFRWKVLATSWPMPFGPIWARRNPLGCRPFWASTTPKPSARISSDARCAGFRDSHHAAGHFRHPPQRSVRYPHARNWGSTLFITTPCMPCGDGQTAGLSLISAERNRRRRWWRSCAAGHRPVSGKRTGGRSARGIREALLDMPVQPTGKPQLLAPGVLSGPQGPCHQSCRYRGGRPIPAGDRRPANRFTQPVCRRIDSGPPGLDSHQKRYRTGRGHGLWGGRGLAC